MQGRTIGVRYSRACGSPNGSARSSNGSPRTEASALPTLQLVVTGGYARPESYELVGPLAERSLAGLNLDVVFLGVDGISLTRGLSTHHEVEAHTNLALIERSRRVVVVADASKLGRVA